MAVNTVGGGRLHITPGGDLRWTAHADPRNHCVRPIIDHRNKVVLLGCQSATFDAIWRVWWLLAKAQIRHKFRRLTQIP